VECPALRMSAALGQTFDPVHGETLAADLGDKAEYVLYGDSGHELPQRIWGKLSEDMRRGMVRGDSWWAARADAR